MKQLVWLALLTILISSNSCIQKKNTVPARELYLQAMIQPIPATAKFIFDTSCICCGTLVKSHIDQKYHLYYSRWSRKLGMNAWVTHSEIAHAVSDSPFGPFEFKNVALPAKGEKYWDGLVTHNPTIHYFNGKYYLYYMGNTGDGKPTCNSLNCTHRNNQRIGVAFADDPNGPWTRFNEPVIDVSKMPFGGPVVHLTAITGNPEGPFIKQLNPVITAQNLDFPAEDPFVWYDDKSYYAIVKDMNGAFTNAGRSLALFCSEDGLNWEKVRHPLVSKLEIEWENNTKSNGIGTSPIIL